MHLITKPIDPVNFQGIVLSLGTIELSTSSYSRLNGHDKKGNDSRQRRKVRRGGRQESTWHLSSSSSFLRKVEKLYERKQRKSKKLVNPSD